MSKTIIKKVLDNKNKSITYRELNKKLKEAYVTHNYESVLLFSYAMIEDRLLSMLHHLYIIDRYNNKLVPNDFVDEHIRPLLKFDLNADKNKIYKIYNISTKIKILKILIKKQNIDSAYLYDCYIMIEKNIGLKELKEWINTINSWIKLRNEIIHSSFNKDIDDLNNKLMECAEKGYELANTIKVYTNKLKDNYNQISVRTKWDAIEKVVLKSYKKENFNTKILEELINDGVMYERDFDIFKLDSGFFKGFFFDEWFDYNRHRFVLNDIYNIINIAVNKKNSNNNYDFYKYIGVKLLKLDFVYDAYVQDIVFNIRKLFNPIISYEPDDFIQILEFNGVKYFENEFEWQGVSCFTEAARNYLNLEEQMDKIKLQEEIKKLLEFGKYFKISNNRKREIIELNLLQLNFDEIFMMPNYDFYKSLVDLIPKDIFKLNENETDKTKVLNIIKENGFELLYSDYKIFDDIDIFNYVNEYECKSLYQSNIKKYYINRIYRESNNKNIIKIIEEKYRDVCGNNSRYTYSTGYTKIDKQTKGLVEGNTLIIKSKKINISKLLAYSIADYFISNNNDYNLYIFSSTPALDGCLFTKHIKTENIDNTNNILERIFVSNSTNYRYKMNINEGNKLILFETTNLKETKQVKDIITKIKEKEKNNLLLFIIYTNYKNINNIEDVNGIIEIEEDELIFEKLPINAFKYDCNILYPICSEDKNSFPLIFVHERLINVISYE